MLKILQGNKTICVISKPMSLKVMRSSIISGLNAWHQHAWQNFAWIIGMKGLGGRRNECWTETGTDGRINGIGQQKRQVETARESNDYSLVLAWLSRMKKCKNRLKRKEQTFQNWKHLRVNSSLFILPVSEWVCPPIICIICFCLCTVEILIWIRYCTTWLP